MKLNREMTSFRKINNTKGSMLIISLLLLVTLMGLGSAFVVSSINEQRAAERQRRTVVALQIAEAGIERALYDLKQDFVNDTTDPSWADGDIQGDTTFSIGPDTSDFYSLPYSSTKINNGSYAVELKNTGDSDTVWIKSTGSLGDAVQVIQVYARIDNISPWDTAIFSGKGYSGGWINANVVVGGSVHILGEGLSSSDVALDLKGGAVFARNNYEGMDSSLKNRIPSILNAAGIETLDSEFRVKQGRVDISGSATVGDMDDPSNSLKETVDGSYVTDGFGGSKGESRVYSDNGTKAYDLEDAVSFPKLSDSYPGYSSYQAYLMSQALVLTNELSSIDPNSHFSYTDGTNSIGMDGSGNLTIGGLIYVDGGNDLEMEKDGSAKTITYSGTGTILVTGDTEIEVNLVTDAQAEYTFPTRKDYEDADGDGDTDERFGNILGIMTPNTIEFDASGIDVMGVFYAEDTIDIEKQTDIIGTIVSDYFDMGSGTPQIFQVPDVLDNLPGFMIGQDSYWRVTVVSWQKL